MYFPKHPSVAKTVSPHFTERIGAKRFNQSLAGRPQQTRTEPSFATAIRAMNYGAAPSLGSKVFGDRKYPQYLLTQ